LLLYRLRCMTYFYFIKSSSETPRALAIFRNVSIVGLVIPPDSSLIIEL